MMSAILKVMSALLVLFLTGLTFINLVIFLSQQKILNKPQTSDIYLPLLIDGCCLILFIIQHSFMKMAIVTNLIKKYGLEIFQRAIYVISTALVLQLMMRYWKSTDNFIFWKIDTSENDIWWWSFTIIHSFCWFIIYGGCLIMDLYEMIGVKQIYYNIRKLESPCQYKSEHLLRLYDHCRHPSMLSLALILWVYPIMSLDRLMMAIVFTLYALLGFQSDHLDYEYQKQQIYQKKTELTYCF